MHISLPFFIDPKMQKKKVIDFPRTKHLVFIIKAIYRIYRKVREEITVVRLEKSEAVELLKMFFFGILCQSEE